MKCTGVAVANVQIVVFTDSSTASDIVDIISPTYFLDSSGKGRLVKFGFGADGIHSIQTWNDDGASTGAEIFLALELQEWIPFVGFVSFIALVPAAEITVEKASLPTVSGVLDTIC